MMRKLFNPGFENSPGSKQTSPESSISKILPGSSSQNQLTKNDVEEEKLTGETEDSADEKRVLFFCPMKSIEVINKIAEGDGGGLPAEASVEGLTVPKDLEPGLYTLKNVILTSGDTMKVIATAQTVWEKYTENTAR